VATFVIDLNGDLLVADRRSEHVACAGGGPVLSAGEMFFLVEEDRVEVTDVSNQSTGYCPEPSSWPGVAAALDRIGSAILDSSPWKWSSGAVRGAASGMSSRMVGSCAACAERSCP
jgi:hypothetical protein